MYCKCHKVNFKNCGSYIDSPNQIKYLYIQYAATVPLNFEETASHTERVPNIIPFINKYNCEGINYPSKIDDWKRYGKNNLSIALNILYTKEKEICPTYISNHNSTREKQIILLMIPNEEKNQMALSYSKNFICIIETNNIKKSW